MRTTVVTVIALLVLSCLSCDSAARDKAVARVKPTAVGSRVGLGDLHALVVGISDYQSTQIRRLKLSAKDAEDFARFLKSQEGKLFRKSHVKLLTNRQATKRRVTHHLFQGLRKAHKRDTVIIFLSGHGMEDPTTPGEHYFLTYDADPGSLESTAVNITRTRFVNRLDAKKILLIADACQAGGYSYEGTKAAGRNAAIDSLLDRFKESEGELILTSSRADEYSREKPEYGNSLFTYHLIEGLKGAGDANKDGLVALKELYGYVYEKTKNDSNGLQSPQMRGRLVGEFPMALTSLRLLPLPRPRPGEKPPHFAALLLNTVPAGVEVYLGSRSVGRTGEDQLLVVSRLQVGVPHTLNLRKEGFRPKSITVRIPASYAGRVYQHKQILMQMRHDPRQDEVLLKAAYQGDLEGAKRALASGADINATSKGRGKQPVWEVRDGVTALIKTCDALPQSGIGLSFDYFPDRARILLKGRMRVARFLLENGADPNIATARGATALGLASYWGRPEFVDLLLKKGAKVNAQAAISTALIRACRSWSGESFAQLGTGPLKDASARKARVVSLLLANGADINAKDKDGRTALWRAAYDQFAEGVKLLLQSGAYANARDNTGETPLIAACSRWSGTDPEVVSILLSHGADINARAKRRNMDYGCCTALIVATMRRHIELVERLLQGGADPNIDSKNGTALEVAYRKAAEWRRKEQPSYANGYEAIAKLLRRYGAKSVRRGWLGVCQCKVTQSLAKSIHRKTVDGSLVVEAFSGSPAEKAGVRSGDIILKFNSKDVSGPAELRNLVGRARPGSQAKLTIFRNGAQIVVSTDIGERKGKDRLASRSGGGCAHRSDALGIIVESVPKALAEKMDIREGQGVRVKSTDPVGLGARMGLKRGFVVLEVDGKKIKSLCSFHNAVAAAKKNGVIHLKIQVDKSRLNLGFRLG